MEMAANSADRGGRHRGRGPAAALRDRCARRPIREPPTSPCARLAGRASRTGDSGRPYEVVSLLGAGGMAEVYRAKDTRLGRDVAIKVVFEALTAWGGRSSREHAHCVSMRLLGGTWNARPAEVTP